MRQVLNESPGRGKGCSQDQYRFKPSARAGSEITQQMSWGVSSLAATGRVLTRYCGGVRSQGVGRVRPAGFIRLRETKSWLYERRALQ